MNPSVSSADETSRAQLPSKIANIELASLGKEQHRAFHPQHGALTITRQSKAGVDLSFSLELTSKAGDTSEVVVDVAASKSARNYKGQSALGYNYINLDDLQGKSIGYPLHCAICIAARELNADLVVVDDVVEPAMHAMCQKVSMRCLHGESYSIDPRIGESSFRHKSIEKGWQVEF